MALKTKNILRQSCRNSSHECCQDFKKKKPTYIHPQANSPYLFQVALQCDCGRRKDMVACTEAASTYQRSAEICLCFAIWLCSLMSLKHVCIHVPQVCRHRHGQQAVWHAARGHDGHRPVPHEERAETGQVVDVGGQENWNVWWEWFYYFQDTNTKMIISSMTGRHSVIPSLECEKRSEGERERENTAQRGWTDKNTVSALRITTRKCLSVHNCLLLWFNWPISAQMSADNQTGREGGEIVLTQDKKNVLVSL